MKPDEVDEHENVRIAGKATVKDWINIRTRLFCSIEDSDKSNKLWEDAFNIFKIRVKTRYIEPIDYLSKLAKNEGEGFTIVAIQCMLIEFFQAFWEGKIYKNNLGDEIYCQPNEYETSAKLFKNFLITHPMFKSNFNKKQIDSFYTNIRCGLIHEARTKGLSKIKVDSNKLDLIEKINGNEKDFILYRNNFQKALEDYLDYYEKELKKIENKELRINFIRKMDDLCSHLKPIKKVYYFAYASNLSDDKLNKEILNSEDKDKILYFKWYRCYLSNYKLIFNKPSTKDCGFYKANITEGNTEDIVWGVCYEMDNEVFEKLEKLEKGYTAKKINVNQGGGNIIKCKTFIYEKSIANENERPDEKYIRTIISGAKEKGIDKKYIETNFEKYL